MEYFTDVFAVFISAAMLHDLITFCSRRAAIVDGTHLMTK